MPPREFAPSPRAAHVLALACLAAGAACGPGASTPAAAPPNVVVYLVDTLRRDHLGLYGYERDTSPRLDALAADAVVFDAAYSTTAWTRPASASVLTGLLPARHGAVTLDDRVSQDAELLSERLRARGYATAAFVTNVNVTSVWGFDQGFDLFDDVRQRTGENDAEIVVDACLAHLDQLGARPFFLYVHTQDPHGNYDPPGEYATRWRAAAAGPALKPPAISARTPAPALADTVAAYDGEIAYGDAQLGRFLDGLRARGLYANTLVFYLADHGEEFADHGGGGHGHSLYQELVRVPLVVKFPGEAYAGERVAAPVSLLDVVPTVLAQLGGEHLDGLDGEPLTAAFVGDGARPLVLSLDVLRFDETPQIADALVLGDHKLIRRTHPAPSIALYDLARDPGERNDLALNEPELTRELFARLERARADGQAGLQLRFSGAPDAPPTTYAGRLETDGRFVGVERLGFEDEDELVLEPDARVLRFKVVTRASANPRKGGRLPDVGDEDRVLFRLEPPDARFTLTRFASEPAGVPLRAGAAQAPLATLPAGFHAAAPELVVQGPGDLRRTSAGAGLPGAFLTSLVPPAREDFEVDQETRDRLRDLGYTR